MRRHINLVLLGIVVVLGCAGQAAGDWTWFDDFESADVGDSLSSLGYTFEYASETVSLDGVGGSKGVKVATPNSGVTRAGYRFSQEGLLHTGDRVAISIDAQMENASSFGSGSPRPMFILGIANPAFGIFNYAQLGRDSSGAGTLYDQYYLAYFDSATQTTIESDRRPVSEIGLGNNGPGELSDFVRLEMRVEFTLDSKYDVVIDLQDTSGNVLATLNLPDRPLGTLYASQQLSVSFGHFGNSTHNACDNIRFDNFRFESISPTVVADSVTATRGDYLFGDIDDLEFSDNFDFFAGRRRTDIQSRTELTVTAVSPTASPSSLMFLVEGAVFARSDVNQIIELYNYEFGVWEHFDTRPAVRFTDTTTIVQGTGDLSRFVHPGTMQMQGRVRYESTNPRQVFASGTDQIRWLIEP